MKDLRKTGKIAGVVHKKGNLETLSRWRNYMRAANSALPTVWILPSYSLTEDCLMVLPRPLFWKTGTWKPATVDTHNAFSTKNPTRGLILRTEQKSAWFLAGYKKSPGRPRRCWGWIGCEDIFRPGIWKMSGENAQELLGSSQSNVRCSVSETKR